MNKQQEFDAFFHECMQEGGNINKMDVRQVYRAWRERLAAARGESAGEYKKNRLKVAELSALLREKTDVVETPSHWQGVSQQNEFDGAA